MPKHLRLMLDLYRAHGAGFLARGLATEMLETIRRKRATRTAGRRCRLLCTPPTDHRPTLAHQKPGPKAGQVTVVEEAPRLLDAG